MTNGAEKIGKKGLENVLGAIGDIFDLTSFRYDSPFKKLGRRLIKKFPPPPPSGQRPPSTRRRQ
jgi:hypothetical protein